MPLLSYSLSQKILRKYKIPVIKERLCFSPKEAIAFSKRVGFPLVLKVFSSEIFHRTEIGGVKTEIKNTKELKKAFDEILISVKKKRPDARIEGILVQKEIKGIEVILGAKRDALFGPVIMFGAGGIFSELFEDVSFGIVPLTKKEAKEMIKNTKIYKLLSGYRNFPKTDIAKLSSLIMKISQLSLKEKQIKEVDFNPVVCQGKEIFVCDFKFFV